MRAAKRLFRFKYPLLRDLLDHGYLSAGKAVDVVLRIDRFND
jgi:hypothetical protein